MKQIVVFACFSLVLGTLCASVSLAGTVTDIDGNTYETVTIGSQVWMRENLRVTHYRNGVAIPNFTDRAVWGNQTTGAYCEYNSDIDNVAIYGRLYNWYAVADSQNVAPVGWHVASDAEWKQLEMTLGLSQAQADAYSWRGTTEGGKLKETGTAHWLAPNIGASNELGFSALPGGDRGGNGDYNYLGTDACFWTATEYAGNSAWGRYLAYVGSDVGRLFDNKASGFAVRCVKDGSCCEGKRGNVNQSGITDLADLSSLVSYLTGGGYAFACYDGANVNGSGIVDLADLSALVSYLTGGGYVLPNCP